MILNPLTPTKKYIPKICDGMNAKEKIVCVIKNITLQERTNITHSGFTEWNRYETAYDYDYALTFVIEIENLKIGDREIKTGSELIGVQAKGIHRIIQDIVVNGVLGDLDLE